MAARLDRLVEVKPAHARFDHRIRGLLVDFEHPVHVAQAHDHGAADAWFVAFAPEIRPRIVVAVLLPNDGAGGTTAAPLARAILEEGLALTR